jgi:hypothetical protein
MGQEASTLATEYGPQWMNIPNLASRYQVVLGVSVASAADPGVSPVLKSRRAAASPALAAEVDMDMQVYAIIPTRRAGLALQFFTIILIPLYP